MTARHVRAVQHLRGNFTDQTAYEILLVIATDTGHDNEPAFTSLRNIAPRAGCHYNTVTTKLKDLEQDGYIKIEKGGRGGRHAYRLLIDAPQGAKTVTKSVTNGCDSPPKVSQEVSQLSQRVSQLEAKVSQLLSQIEALTVTIAQRDNVTEVSGSILVEEVEDIYTRAHPDPEPIAEIKAALGQTTKTPQLLNEDAYDKAAYQLMGWDATPDQINGFSQWWERNSYYNGKPALKSLVNEWQNYIGGVERDRASPNPRQPTGNEVDTSAIKVNEDGSY